MMVPEDERKDPMEGYGEDGVDWSKKYKKTRKEYRSTNIPFKPGTKEYAREYYKIYIQKKKQVVPTKQPSNPNFIDSFNGLASQVHATAREKGWWDSDRCDAELIALMHSELSEALEALRHGNPADDKVPEYTGVEVEMADVIIRIMDAAQARGWRVAEALAAKVEVNKTRPRMHGGKRF